MKEQGNKLRCVILCNSFLFKKWQADCIQKMGGVADIVLLVVNDNPVIIKSFIQKVKSYSYKNLLYRLMMRFFVRFRTDEMVDMGDFFATTPYIKCKTQLKGRFSEYFSDGDIERIRSFQPDFILRFGYNIIKGSILETAPYGVWSYHHSDEEHYRGGPPVFWEIYRNDPVTGAILQRLTDKVDAGIVLRKGYFKTVLHSYKETNETVMEETSRWVLQACNDIISGNAGNFEKEPSGSTAFMNKFPKNYQTLYFIFRILFNKVAFHFKDLFSAEHWKIGLAFSSPDEILKNGFKGNIKWIESGKREEYYADPFLFDVNGEKHLIFERYSYRNGKAGIAEFVLNGENVSKISEVSFSTDFHLSFPYILEDQNEIYCLPECCESGSLTLYKYNRAENNWIKEAIIMDAPLVDPVVFKYNEKWWLFCTRKDSYTNLNLFIYYSDQLQGPYLPHANNPVKSDIRSVRMAGGIFTAGGKIYRQAQDCSVTYGGAIGVYEIVKLTVNEYTEEFVNKIKSQDKIYNKGIHTISSVKGLTIFDVKKNLFSFYNFKRKLLYKFGSQ